MPTALVTVMLPCFNAADTLRRAFASLRAQTVDSWECVCIDDGSSDATWQIMTEMARRDTRVRVERFSENRGRGAARQRALELATGKYLAFLDSDDWMYPERLERELRWMEADAHIAAVSACAAVTNGSDELVGLMRPLSRAPLPVVAAFNEPVPPPLLFPTSMIQADLAKRTGFDPEFRRSQDSDFLIRALLGRHYALGSEVLYAYSQGTAASLERSLEGYRYRMRSHRRHLRTHPARVAQTLLVTAGKYMTYRLAGAAGWERALIERRWSSFDDETKRGFDAARAIVVATEQQLFGA